MVRQNAHIENGNKNSADSNVSFSVHRSARTRLVYVLIAVAVFLLITAVVFLALFAHYYTKYDNAKPVKEQIQTCNTPNCVLAASTLVRKMNLTVDPCLDFHEFACGGFNKEAVILEGRTTTGTFTMIADGNELVMKEIVAEDIRSSDPSYLQNMKRLYKCCLNEAQIEKNGLKGYLEDRKFVDDWPTLNNAWVDSNFNLKDTIVRYTEVYISGLFTSSVGLDLSNSSRKVLYLSDSKLGLSQEYYSRPNNDSVLVAYKTFLVETAVALGANRTIAEDDVEEIIKLETSLSKIMPSPTDRRDIAKMNNPMTLSQLAINYSDIYVKEALDAVYNTANVTLSENDTVINFFPSYFGNLSGVLQNFSNRTIQNLFGLKYALLKVRSLTKQMRELNFELEKVYSGKTEESPRWKYCLSVVSTLIPKGMSKQFVSRTFPEKAKIYMTDMIDNLMTSFRKMLEETTWMGQNTKEAAYKKLTAMKRKIGYPDAEFTDNDINQLYENYHMVETDMYNNIQMAIKLTRIEGMASYRKPIDKNEWAMYPHEVNAYYAPSTNEIAFPAGILQSPVFSIHFQNAINYGSIGMVIGHEITHGFDITGSQFNEIGNLVNWWNKSDYDVYLQRTKCVIDQYSGFHLKQINMSINGALTQGENVADNGGLKESFRAFKALVNKEGEQPKLPGLDLTQDQLFFLAFGQTWCDKRTRENLIISINSDTHSPAKYRIIGTLQNSEDFAKAYNCPTGSYMNPVKKCSVW